MRITRVRWKSDRVPRALATRWRSAALSMSSPWRSPNARPRLCTDRRRAPPPPELTDRHEGGPGPSLDKCDGADRAAGSPAVFCRQEDEAEATQAIARQLLQRQILDLIDSGLDQHMLVATTFRPARHRVAPLPWKIRQQG